MRGSLREGGSCEVGTSKNLREAYALRSRVRERWVTHPSWNRPSLKNTVTEGSLNGLNPKP